MYACVCTAICHVYPRAVPVAPSYDTTVAANQAYGRPLQLANERQTVGNTQHTHIHAVICFNFFVEQLQGNRVVISGVGVRDLATPQDVINGDESTCGEVQSLVISTVTTLNTYQDVKVREWIRSMCHRRFCRHL